MGHWGLETDQAAQRVCVMTPYGRNQYTQYPTPPYSPCWSYPPFSQQYPPVTSIEHFGFHTASPPPLIWHGARDPMLGKVCYLPDGKTIPKWSVVHAQKCQDGFFKHPVLVIEVEFLYIYFYALTRVPPVAIAQLGMCMRIGSTQEDEGPGVLKLAQGSSKMYAETWINLEQRFKIERTILVPWSLDVRIAECESLKLNRKIGQLETGTVVLLLNPPGSATIGAPVVVLENRYPQFRFLRIKAVKDNITFKEPLHPAYARARQSCLVIEHEFRVGHGGAPVMLLEPYSPNLREKSYVEVIRKPKWGHMDRCQTWCWPPVIIQEWSIKLLQEWIACTPSPQKGLHAQPVQQNWMAIPRDRSLAIGWYGYGANHVQGRSNTMTMGMGTP
ncbi:hypothetical protein CC78DRAFT_614820 [Lojkania enalia]|uniref:Uncharacterized protein n=1 Tax=Lojkania enalia TaxID=147567 RepID=A0A9P4N7J8_9PLEO|nr:hypothetical protein CC78DRAFT_614820 [Didymosphaeria enalia]